MPPYQKKPQAQHAARFFGTSPYLTKLGRTAGLATMCCQAGHPGVPGFAFGWFSSWLVTLGSSLVICPITAPKNAPCRKQASQVTHVGTKHCSSKRVLPRPVHASNMLWFLSMFRRLLLQPLQGCTVARPLRLRKQYVWSGRKRAGGRPPARRHRWSQQQLQCKAAARRPSR